MLTELEIEEIQRDLLTGADARRLVTWVEKLLEDREERIVNEREVAVQLLSKAPAHAAAHGHHEAAPQAPRAGADDRL